MSKLRQANGRTFCSSISFPDPFSTGPPRTSARLDKFSVFPCQPMLNIRTPHKSARVFCKPLLLTLALSLGCGQRTSNAEPDLFEISISSSHWVTTTDSPGERSLELTLSVKNHSDKHLVFLKFPFESSLSFQFENQKGQTFEDNFSALSTPLPYVKESDFVRLSGHQKREFVVSLSAAMNKKGNMTFKNYDCELKSREVWAVKFYSDENPLSLAVMSKDGSELLHPAEYFGDATVVPSVLASETVRIPAW